MSRLICHSIRSNKDGLYIFKIFLKVSHPKKLINDERRSKIVGNRVFDCHLSPDFSIAMCRPIFRLPCVARLATNGNQNFCKNRMFN